MYHPSTVIRQICTCWFALLLVGLPVASVVTAQVPPEDAIAGARVSVAPNPRYSAGPLHRWIFGTEYRDIWGIPVKIEVMDISKFAGGLTPIKKGGFGQTTSLHMRGTDGIRYVFRSLDKDPARGLPDDLRHTFVGNVVNDQISSQHPYASLIIPKLSDALGILHVTPTLYVMPNDPVLGEFQEEFAGLVGAIEERPNEGPDGEPGFAGSTKVSSSSGMFDDLEKDARQRVDAVSFLRARLFDVYVGDRDRHFDQWRWARMENADGSYRWLPVPKDRDQAFKINDGLMMSLTRIYQRQYVSFSGRYPSIEGASFNGREMDRRLLVGLKKAVWDSVAADMEQRLTDTVIVEAVSNLPAEIYAFHGKELEDQLKTRRDQLRQMSDDYYSLLAKYVDLHSTDEDDVAEIERLASGAVHVKVLTSGVPYFDRTFLPEETKEIRILTHGGSDRITVRGDSETSIKLRILPGGGDDVMVDSSFVRGSGGETLFYDDRGDNSVILGKRSKLDESKPHERHPDELFLPPAPEDDEARMAQSWGRYTYPLALVYYAPDHGAIAGAGGFVVKHGWRKLPFKYRWQTMAQFSTSGRGKIATGLSFPNASSKLSVTLSAYYSGLEFVRFFGFGNETDPVGDFPGEDFDSEFYRTRHTDLFFSPSLDIDLGGKTSLELGPAVQFVGVRSDADELLGQPFAQQSFFGSDDDLVLVSGNASLQIDTRDNPGAAASGFHLHAGGKLVPRVLGVDDEARDEGSYGRIFGSAAAYFTPGNAAKNPMVALRVGGEKVLGDFDDVPFYEAAFIGGAKNVRGFRENRFAGDAAVYGNAEVRLKVIRVKLIFPWDVGVHGLVDAGRVWYEEGDGADKIHTAFGGGLWLGILNRTQTISFSVASSDEETLFYARAGFHF
ncbi:MAG: BamA/TamA family outer membrane protein [Rhodothermales bacterium]|nr:BamA/TamA family outer membrane protein [Rhodothermales bacterium]